MADENIEEKIEEKIIEKVKLQQDRKRRLFEYQSRCELILVVNHIALFLNILNINK